MAWQRKEPGHLQAWYWRSPPKRIFSQTQYGWYDMVVILKIVIVGNQGPLLLTWFNFNPSMDK